MKAVIFNSGLGKRMGELTKNSHKSMVYLKNGETIFERQIRVLMECGVSDFVVTVGPFKEQLIQASKKFIDARFTFVDNPIYDKTNYIYSMYLAREYLNDDVLLLHGDLVFDSDLVMNMLRSNGDSICLINENRELPEKDFKGRIQNGYLKEVGINIFDNDCYAFQPLYKLDKKDLLSWVDKVVEFIQQGNDKVYAENALNTILDILRIRAYSYANNYIDEVDTEDDLKRVSSEIECFEKSKVKALRKNYGR